MAALNSDVTLQQSPDQAIVAVANSEVAAFIPSVQGDVSVNETLASTETPTGPYFPKAILSVSRREHYQQPLGLNILSRKNDDLQADAVDPSSSDFIDPKYWQRHSPNESEDQGPLPPTLTGHVFIIGTAASFDSQKVLNTESIYRPTQDGWQHIYSGDGMIYRLDFHTSVGHPQNTMMLLANTLTHLSTGRGGLI